MTHTTIYSSATNPQTSPIAANLSEPINVCSSYRRNSIVTV